jgi:hypothetical protein
MKYLTLNFKGTNGDEVMEGCATFKRTHMEDERDFTTCAISLYQPNDKIDAGQAKARTLTVVAVGQTRLGRRDHYRFFTGCRITLVRACETLKARGYDLDFVKAMRRSLQIELSLVENDANGQDAYNALERLRDQRVALLKAKAAPLARKRAVELLDAIKGVLEAVEAAEREKKADGTLSKPAAYKNVADGGVIPEGCAECQGPHVPRGV